MSWGYHGIFSESFLILSISKANIGSPPGLRLRLPGSLAFHDTLLVQGPERWQDLMFRSVYDQ